MWESGGGAAVGSGDGTDVCRYLPAAAGLWESTAWKEKGKTFMGRDSMTADKDLQT